MTAQEQVEQICKRISELDGIEIKAVQQPTSGRIEITDVFARFVSWESALEHMKDHLAAAELHYHGRRKERKPGWDKSKRTRKV